MWEKRSIEKRLQERLRAEFPESKADAHWADYVSMREALNSQILPEIKAIEPSLTMHDASHIGNVLDNIDRLLGDEVATISAFDLYILCVCVLFHDAGNISGRKRHNQEISKVYESIKDKVSRSRPEQAVVLRIAGAHTGRGKGGTQDTLKDVPTEMSVGGIKVQAQRLAAVLRLADELAEGPQRTSWYMLEKGKYDEGSEIHHVHSSCLDLNIDRGAGRIALTYDFSVVAKAGSAVVHKPQVKETPLDALLKFTYERIIKLDIERKYTKHYCDLLAPFKTVSVTLRFWSGGTEIEIGLNPLTLTDLVVPGDQVKGIDQIDGNYEATRVLGKILSLTTQAG